MAYGVCLQLDSLKPDNSQKKRVERSVTVLTNTSCCKLFSPLQAIISQWDSHVELQRASLPGRHRGNVLLEQEKQRTLALQREEQASFHKLQSQHRQEQQRLEREKERHRQQVEATEARLRKREEECRRLEVRRPVLGLFSFVIKKSQHASRLQQLGVSYRQFF